MSALTHARLYSQVTFTGSGNTLNGRPVQSMSGKGKEKAVSSSQPQASQKSWGTGQTLGSRAPLAPHVPPSFQGRSLGTSTASLPIKSQPKRRSPTPDWGVDDDDIIEIDSD